MDFTTYSALSPVMRLPCHRRLRLKLPPGSGSTPPYRAPGPHDFAVCLSAGRPRPPGSPGPRPAFEPAPRLRNRICAPTLVASTAFRPAFVTPRTPLSWDG